MSRTDPETTLEDSIASPPINAERLLQLITDEYESLPRQLKRIASYMSQQSDRIMVDRISDIARECEVHPSAIVRFSQRFGFSGFSEMQALFREAYTHKTTPVQNYQQRIRSMIANKSQKASGGDLARECVNATLSGIERRGHRVWRALRLRRRRREEGEVVQARSDSTRRVAARLKLGQHRAGAGDDRRWEASELGDRDAITAVGGAVRDLVKQDQVALPLARADMVQRQAIEPPCQPSQLVIVGRKQGAALHLVVHRFDHCPSDR